MNNWSFFYVPWVNGTGNLFWGRLTLGVLLPILPIASHAQEIAVVKETTSAEQTTTVATPSATTTNPLQQIPLLNELPQKIEEKKAETTPVEPPAPVVESPKVIKQQQVEQRVQQLLQQQPAVKPLQFDDLDQYDAGAVNTAMLDEIYKVAEQAKRDAEQWQRTGERVETQNTPATSTLPLPTEQQTVVESTPVNVTELMKQIQQDSQIVVETTHAVEQQQEDIFKTPSIEQDKKLSWFERWKANRTIASRAVREVKYIKVDVLGTDNLELKNNLKASFSNVTVESFQEYQSMIPELRKIANQSAQAVGYYEAEFQFKKSGNDHLTVTVKPNQPVTVKSQSIEFSGAGEYLPQFQIVNIIPDLDIDHILNHGLYSKTKERIEQAGQDNGFFDAYWRLHDVKVTLPDNTADIQLKYETGERYRLGNVEFRMHNDQPLPINLNVLQSLVPWNVGDDYTSWRTTLLSNHLSNTRYFNSVNVNAIIPDPLTKQQEIPADVQALLEKQKALQQQQKDDESLSSFGFVGMDEPATSTTATTSQVEIAQATEQAETIAQSSQTAQQNEISQLQEKARLEKEIPVIVTLNADKLNSSEIGLGYGTDTGIRLRSQYRRAIVNRYGHNFLANVELSKIRQAIDTRYNIPHPHPINRYIALVAGYERESDFSVGQGMSLVSENAVLGSEYVMKSNRFDAWQHALGLRYRLDRLTVNGDVAIEDIPQEFMAVRGNADQQSLLLSYKASKVSSDSALNPTKGMKQHYKIELGSKDVLSSVDMAILSAGMSFIYSFGENNNHQVLGRAEGNYMFTNDFSQVPYNLRFFAGGDQSLRGFDYKSLSPTINGLKVGGQALAIGSLEYNYQVREGWRVGLFSDFGNSYDENFSNPLAYSVGLGVRWISPIGPIRFDIATGLSDENHPVRLHFFIGSPL